MDKQDTSDCEMVVLTDSENDQLESDYDDLEELEGLEDEELEEDLEEDEELEEDLEDEELEGLEEMDDNSPNDIDNDKEVEDTCKDNENENCVVESSDEMEVEDEITPKKRSIFDKEVVPAPKEGMIFASWEKVDEYYRQYGEQEGFGVIMPHSSYFKNSKQRRCVTWKCENAGKPDKRNKGVVPCRDEGDGGNVHADGKRNKSSKKQQCTAKIYASAVKDGTWVLKTVILKHSDHDATPSKSRLVKGYRKMDAHVKRKLFNGVAAGLRVSQVAATIATERNGLDNMPVTVKDMRNAVDLERKLKLQEGDANAMMKYFEKMHKDNSNFFHSIRHDQNGTLTDVLWVDARSRAAYDEFGDVVCFDTTYLTNKYDLPFANFVGVNHHGQSILLGCALISHEDADTFEWIFSTWLLCMGDKPPVGILTDQAQAMRTALAKVMPQTTHRWCLWHIMKKFPLKLNFLNMYDEWFPKLKNIIYGSTDGSKFESQWLSLMREYELDDEWLNGLYEERVMWVPGFLKHIFWAGMRSTQRIESIHSYFDKFFTPHTRLYEFVEQYCSAMERRAASEKDADDNDCRIILTGASVLAVEKFFLPIYTREKAVEIQNECGRVAYCNVCNAKDLTEEEIECVISDRVYMFLNGEKKATIVDEWTSYVVHYNKVSHDISCECKMFESDGIMCRHCVKVYEYYGVKVVPNKYVLRRWRKDVKRKHTRVKVAYHDPSKSDEVKRYDALHVAFEPLVEEVMGREDASELLYKKLQSLKLEVEDFMGNDPSSRVDENNGKDLTVEIVSKSIGLVSTPGTQRSVVANTPNSTAQKSYVDPKPRARKRGRVSVARRTSKEEIFSNQAAAYARKAELAAKKAEAVKAAKAAKAAKLQAAKAAKLQAAKALKAGKGAKLSKTRAGKKTGDATKESTTNTNDVVCEENDRGRWIGGIQMKGQEGELSYFSRPMEGKQVKSPTSSSVGVEGGVMKPLKAPSRKSFVGVNCKPQPASSVVKSLTFDLNLPFTG